jgi:hypothetical protein
MSRGGRSMPPVRKEAELVDGVKGIAKRAASTKSFDASEVGRTAPTQQHAAHALHAHKCCTSPSWWCAWCIWAAACMPRICNVSGHGAIDVARVRTVMSGLPRVAIHRHGRKRLNREAQHEQDDEDEFAPVRHRGEVKHTGSNERNHAIQRQAALSQGLSVGVGWKRTREAPLATRPHGILVPY